MATEKRHLVDVNDFVKTVYKKQSTVTKIANSSIALSLLNRLASFPQVDAVEVVRCFECQKEGTEDCPMVSKDCLTGCLCANTKGTDFCSYGERRTDHV